MEKEKFIERNGVPACPCSEIARVRHSAKIGDVGVSLRKVNIIPASSGSLIPTYGQRVVFIPLPPGGIGGLRRGVRV